MDIRRQGNRKVYLSVEQEGLPLREPGMFSSQGTRNVFLSGKQEGFPLARSPFIQQRSYITKKHLMDPKIAILEFAFDIPR